MKSIFLGSQQISLWDDCVRRSNEAWFWHTTHWMTLTAELSSEYFVENASFFVIENSQVIALCPLLIEKDISSQGEYLQFCYSRWSTPAPVVINTESHFRKQKIIEFCLDEINRIAEEKKIAYIRLHIPVVTETYMTESLPRVNPFVKYGYTYLPYQTQVIDLRNNENVLWRAIRKGHQADIKKSSQMLNITIWDAANITYEKFRQYQDLHHKDAGRVTRPQQTFDLMYSWILNGESVLIEASFEGRPVGFVLIIVYKKGAYYGSTCKDPDYIKVPAGHLIQWEAIKYLKNRGVFFYDLGLQEHGSQWFHNPSSKEISIAQFKRGFGGVTVPLMMSEYFFSKDLMREKYLQRMNENLGLQFKQ